MLVGDYGEDSKMLLLTSRLASISLSALTVLAVIPSMAQEKPSPVETKQIAEEAFIYGFPMVMNYTVFYEYFVDKSAKEYKARPNKLYTTARVYTPEDT